MQFSTGLGAFAAIGLGLAGPAIGQSASANWLEASSNPDIRSASSTLMVSYTKPFSGGLDVSALESESRFEMGVNLIDPHRQGAAFSPRPTYSFGITGSGLRYAGLGDQRLTLQGWSLQFNADEDGEAETGGNNTGLFILGGVVAVVGLGAIVVADVEDTINDCAVDLINGPTGGCPLADD